MIAGPRARRLVERLRQPRRRALAARSVSRARPAAAPRAARPSTRRSRRRSAAAASRPGVKVGPSSSRRSPTIASFCSCSSGMKLAAVIACATSGSVADAGRRAPRPRAARARGSGPYTASSSGRSSGRARSITDSLFGSFRFSGSKSNLTPRQQREADDRQHAGAGEHPARAAAAATGRAARPSETRPAAGSPRGRSSVKQRPAAARN